jgi:hypothetical protein
MVEVQNGEFLIRVVLLSPDIGYPILGIYIGTVAIGCLTMAEITCIKLNCLLEISFSPNVGLSVP